MDPPASVGMDGSGEVEELPAMMLEDIINAFNESACELAPGVVRLFRTFYGHSAILYDKQG